MAVAFRYSSLSALAACVITPLFVWWLGHTTLAELFAVLSLLLIFMHRANIGRLMAGTEGRIGPKAQSYGLSPRPRLADVAALRHPYINPPISPAKGPRRLEKGFGYCHGGSGVVSRIWNA